MLVIRIKTGREAKKNREEKLPCDIALNALAEIFATNPINERDIFTSSVFAMLMSAPSRITEVLALPAIARYLKLIAKV